MFQFVKFLSKYWSEIITNERRAFSIIGYACYALTAFCFCLVGEVLSFDNFIYSIFEFITALVEAPKFKKTVKEYLEDILFHTIIYMQITEEQVR